MATQTKKKITKAHNHHHFWIDDSHLFETYETIRGLRWRHILEVPGMQDTDKCSDDCIKYIEKEYLS